METKIYQFKITLKESANPQIWRQVQVENSINLQELQFIFNEAMGWENYNDHDFIIDGKRYSAMNPEFADDDVIDEETIQISDILNQEGQKFEYVYDFGDEWEHEIVLEKIFEPEEDAEYPTCIAGEGACPPEDCGGVLGYENLCEILNDPRNNQYAKVVDWLGTKHWDKNEFNLEETRFKVYDSINFNKEMMDIEE